MSASSVTPPFQVSPPLFEKKEPPKKIFIFCDGTGNEFSASDANSNVVKLYSTIRVGKDPQTGVEQVAYYHPGVGTMGDPNARNRFTSFWSKLMGLAFGAGFRDNVLDAYRYLMEVYNDGDEIYLFGFSRGAYTARAVAGLLHGYGLLCRGNEGHLMYAWRLFVEALDKQQAKLAGRRDDLADHSISRDHLFADVFSRKVTIRFCGVWDTVSAVGWITSPLRLLDLARNPIIQVGRHAISIDERRCFYHDNIWGTPFDSDDPEWKAAQPVGLVQDIFQVWFPGVHSDVGGSYPQSESGPSLHTLRWMVNELDRTNPDIRYIGKRKPVVLCETIDNTCDVQSINLWPNGWPADPYFKRHDQLTKQPLWWLLEFLPHLFWDKDGAQVSRRIPFGARREVPRGAVLHTSVHDLIHRENYNPRNLRVNGSPQIELITELQPGEPPSAIGMYRYTGGKQMWRNRFLVRWFWLIVIPVLEIELLVCAIPALFRWIAHLNSVRCVFHVLAHFLAAGARLILCLLHLLHHILFFRCHFGHIW